MLEKQSSTETPQHFKPYVPAETTMKEFTFRALFFGAILAVILGSANAYIGLKVGMTVAATFPAAVMAMAILRAFKGTILEENTCRTTAAVGEALAAGAIFTIPALLIAKNPVTGKPIWDNIHYVESTILMITGGILGVLFVTFLRRILIEDKTLRFPESLACAEMVKAGQGQKTGAKYVFSAMLLSGIFELFKNKRGLWAVRESVQSYFPIKVNNFHLSIGDGANDTLTSNPTGGVFVETPGASAMLMGVGFIIGPKLASITFAGGVFGHLVLVPLFMFIFGGYENYVNSGASWVGIANGVFASQAKPFAVGTMLVGAVYTLFKMRNSLGTGIARAVRDLKQIGKAKAVEETNRLDRDIPYSVTTIGIFLLIIPIAVIYYLLCHNLIGAIVAAVVMTITGFLFAAVAGFLVGTIGSSNNPISGITLSTLIVAAFLMTAIGVTGAPGIAAVLGVAAVVCCSSGVAGDIMQDLKVGHILGLVVIGAPSIMLIAVGMYLPLYVTAGIFVGGVIKSIVDKIVAKKNLNAEKVENTGILLSSGFIAGEAIMALIIAATILAGKGKAILPKLIENGNPWFGLIVFAIVTYVLIAIPLNSVKKEIE